MDSATADRFWINGDQWTELLSTEPRISICHNFLSKEECEQLINLGKPHMKRSLLYDKENPRVGKISSGRTSTGMFLRIGKSNKVTLDIAQRIAGYTSMPIENGGGLQVLHYEVGQKIEPHYDHLPAEQKIHIGSRRAVTVIMYLSDVEEGGETFFPKAKSGNNIISSNVRSTDKGIYVKPKMGDALIFWNLKPDGTEDWLTLHGSAPVIKGNKWACTQWLHDGRYQHFATTPLNLASMLGATTSLKHRYPYVARSLLNLASITQAKASLKLLLQDGRYQHFATLRRNLASMPVWAEKPSTQLYFATLRRNLASMPVGAETPSTQLHDSRYQHFATSPLNLASISGAKTPLKRLHDSHEYQSDATSPLNLTSRPRATMSLTNVFDKSLPQASPLATTAMKRRKL